MPSQISQKPSAPSQVRTAPATEPEPSQLIQKPPAEATKPANKPNASQKPPAASTKPFEPEEVDEKSLEWPEASEASKVKPAAKLPVDALEAKNGSLDEGNRLSVVVGASRLLSAWFIYRVEAS